MATHIQQPIPLWRHRSPGKPKPSSQLNEVSIVALDTETTGSAADLGHRITEIAIVGRDLDRFRADIDHHEQNARAIRDLHHEITDRLRHRVVVGHNIVFDLEFLAREFERIPGAELPPINFIDTLTLAKRVLADGGPWTLGAVASRLGIKPDGPLHTALVDAELTLAILESLIIRLDLSTLQDLGLRRIVWRGETI